MNRIRDLIRYIRMKDSHLINRWFSFWWQRRVRGWDDTDIWNLDETLAKYILPRLKRYKEIHVGHPCNLTQEEWDSELDVMINAMKLILDYDIKPDNINIINSGTKKFGKRFINLWC